jgi:hypothetical protein
MAKRGRPFTYQSEDERPVTVSLRIPRDLYERMSRYSARHRQSVTELLLDGLTWRLDQDDPRTQSMSDLLYYDNTILQELAKPAHLLDALIPFDEDLAAFPATLAATAPDLSADRQDISNYNNTVLQESQQPPPLSADSPGGPEAAPQPSIALPHYDNMVLQESAQPLPEIDAPLPEYNNTVIQEKVSAKRSGRSATMREPILNLLRDHPEGLTAEQIRGLLNAQKPIGDTLQGMRRGNLVRTEGQGREMRYFLA